jgi:uncharacterized protein YceH (UPF0502 family)
MTKFTPLIDSNTKNVLQWTMTDISGQEIVKSTPRQLWKLEKDWTETELYNFFAVSYATTEVKEELIATTEEANEDLEDRVEELSEELEEIKEHLEKKSFLEG